MDRPKLVDEFAALGLLRDEPPDPPPSSPSRFVEAPGPVLSEDGMRSVLRKAAASAGDCVKMLAEAMESMRGVQEALQAVADGSWVGDEPVVEIEAEPPPPVPAPVALADTAKLRAPVATLEAVIATTAGEVARAPATEAGEMPWVAVPAPFGVAEGFGAAAVMVPESVPLPSEEPPQPLPKKEE